MSIFGWFASSDSSDTDDSNDSYQTISYRDDPDYQALLGITPESRAAEIEAEDNASNDKPDDGFLGLGWFCR
jgi:hypothetical protein